MFLKTTFFAVLFVSLITGCSKSDTITNETSLEGSWAVTAISSNNAYDWDGDGDTETDIFGTYSTCRRDIVLNFEQNGYGQTRQGCNAPWENMNWQLTNGNSRLNISFASGDINLDITQFNDNTIRGNDEVTVNGQTVIIGYTLSRR